MRRCEVYILKDTQNPIGHGPWQPAPGDSAGAQRHWIRQFSEVPSNLNNFVILLSCPWR